MIQYDRTGLIHHKHEEKEPFFLNLRYIDVIKTLFIVIAFAVFVLAIAKYAMPFMNQYRNSFCLELPL